MSAQETSLLEQMLVEQKKQTSLLEQIALNQIALIEALADDQGIDTGEVPLTYLSGAPVRGGS
ncbi:hypothetical protein [Pseudomonas mosselii]|uniref:hypothetical protein n=1 Tax=Pseudomonas mosselii TaxID=78327 RepID=UPI001E2FBA08|nr:hypothetical protein [Pseudomonas mosselii]MCL8303171.1 hypothetical protein [Pseudomonas mosselii]MCL8343278.1 hypothetical protein [Pseudomonas mosselii]WJR27788.1 hypothetical protein LU678_026095 [Pseudomonas mosselii]WJR30082.1 hypothetical protein LU678_008555 [Pseudomonas mosselii]